MRCRKLYTVGLACLAVLCSCRRDRDSNPSGPLSGSPNVAPVGEIIGTAVPLAYAATLAMATMAGNRIPCVAVTSELATPPCSASMTVALDSNCVLPLGSVGTGLIVVTGSWVSDTEATLAAAYEGVAIDEQSLFVRQGGFSAVLEGDTIITAYADQNVRVATPDVAEIAQSAWTVSISTAGTLADPSDDIMRITGSRQYVSGASVSEVIFTDVVMSPGCRKNPTDGVVSIGELSGTSSGVTVLGFHTACDGMADVTASLYVQWIGDPIALDLLY